MSYDPTSTEGVPEHGRERLAQMKRGLFTSDLSVNEFLLVKQAGFDPLGLVIGSSIYHIGFQQSNWKQSMEMAVLFAGDVPRARAGDDADGGGGRPARRRRRRRRPARHRPLRVGRRPGGVHRDRNGDQTPRRRVHRAPNGRPFTSDLSGQDFWTLLSSGHRPVGMVMGSCVYHVAHQGMFQAMRQIGQNLEMPNFTQALYDARELAMERMQNEAEALQAEGIVGVQLLERSHGWGSHVIEFFAVGTAVVPVEDAHALPAPTPTINLST